MSSQSVPHCSRQTRDQSKQCLTETWPLFFNKHTVAMTLSQCQQGIQMSALTLKYIT